MYGLINLAIEEAILERYGQKFWDYIKEACRDTIGDTDGTFISRLFYDDELTYQLIATAERILHCEKYGQLSQLFGEKFFDLVQDSGYEGILKLLAGNLKDFLNNLDSFHTHLSATFSRMRPPSFRCSNFDEAESVTQPNVDVAMSKSGHSTSKAARDKLVLHYYSERVGLEGIVMGMVRAAARQLYHLKVKINIAKMKHLDQGQDHTEFLITILEQTATLDTDACLHSVDESISYKDIAQLAQGARLNKVSPLVFAQVLPFHVVFDRKLCIRQAGTSILRVIPALNTKRNVKLTDVMNLLEPKCLRGKFNFENILKYTNSVYVFRPDERQVISSGHRHLHGDNLKRLKTGEVGIGDVASENTYTKPTNELSGDHGRSPLGASNAENITGAATGTGSAMSTGDASKKPTTSGDCELSEQDIDKYIVKLRGQMTYLPDKDLMLFVCSPSVANLDDLNNTGLFLSDIPLHDATRDLVLVSEQFEAEYKVQTKLTMLTDQLNVMKKELEEEKKKTDRLLYSVLPPTVANELRNNRPVAAKRYQPVTILFSGIVGFGDFCAKNSDSSGAIRIVNLLNKIYTTFDVLTDTKRNPYVYKVETVGDKYMAVSGLPETCDSHARHICRLALDIMDLSKTIKLGEYTGYSTSLGADTASGSVTGSASDFCDHLRVTIGIHCGEVVTGVIGKRTPRYCLFGNTVNLTSRCETTGRKGSINVSQDVHSICTRDSNNFDPEFEFDFRGQVNMKGKSEPMGMYFLTRRRLTCPE